MSFQDMMDQDKLAPDQFVLIHVIMRSADV